MPEGEHLFGEDEIDVALGELGKPEAADPDTKSLSAEEPDANAQQARDEAIEALNSKGV